MQPGVGSNDVLVSSEFLNLERQVGLYDPRSVTPENVGILCCKNLYIPDSRFRDKVEPDYDILPANADTHKCDMGLSLSAEMLEAYVLEKCRGLTSD